MLQPRDSEFINCQKHVKDIKSDLRLPKIERIKPHENTLKQVHEKQRVDKENQILKRKMSHLSLEKKKKQ